MKIADFFVSLGFDVKGKEDVEKAEVGVAKLENASLHLLAGVTAVNTAFYAMMTLAVDTGVALQRFALTTGISSTELQQWQLMAVKGNVAAGKIAESIMAIQKAQAALMFGDSSAASPWILLGIDPRQDPMKMLEQLQKRIVGMNPAIAGKILGDMGLSQDLYYFMKQQNFGRGGLDRRLTVSPEESDRLARLGSAWKEFLFTLNQVGTRFAAQFADPLAAVLKGFTHALMLAGKFVDWLDSGSKGANAFKYAVLGVLTVLGGLTVALGLLALPFSEIVATIGLIAIAIAGLILVIQDFWGAIDGKKSFFNWNKGLLFTVQNVERLAKAIEWVVEKMTMLDEKFKSGIFSGALGVVKAGQGGGIEGMLARGLISLAGGNTNQNQTNHINVTVAPGSNPHETGQAVGRGAQRQITDAFGQMPAPSR